MHLSSLGTFSTMSRVIAPSSLAAPCIISTRGGHLRRSSSTIAKSTFEYCLRVRRTWKTKCMLTLPFLPGCHDGVRSRAAEGKEGDSTLTWSPP